MDLPPKIAQNYADKRGAVVHTNVGTLINVNHGKFILVLKNIGGRVGYCVINSDIYGQDPESKIKIDVNDQPVLTNEDCPALSHEKSYVNCANVKLIDEAVLKAKIVSGDFQLEGVVDESRLQVILARGQACKVLKPFQRQYFDP